MITVTDQKFYSNKTWDNPIPFSRPEAFTCAHWVELFDQNGYRLTPLEQEYSKRIINVLSFIEMRSL